MIGLKTIRSSHTHVTSPDYTPRLETGGFGPAWGLNELDNDDETSVGGWDRIERQEFFHTDLHQVGQNPLLRICDIVATRISTCIGGRSSPHL